MTDSRERAWSFGQAGAAAVLVLLTLLAFASAMDAGFLWDDHVQIVDNPSLRSAAGLKRIWAGPSSQMQYYPLTYSMHWLEYAVWGDAPAGYHVVSIALHAANAVLVYLVLFRLRVPAALLAAMVFALHPVQVESVAWLAERRNVLSGSFYLLSALFRLSFVESRRIAIHAAALGLFALAMLSKTAVCTLPVVMLGHSLWRGGPIETEPPLRPCRSSPSRSVSA